jgi:hypothetical protein
MLPDANQSIYLAPMSASKSNHPNADVRMRGFAQRTTVDDALAWLIVQ